MANTPRMNWPFPNEDDAPWYERLKAFVQSQDASGYAAREDRQIVLAGGGTVLWSATGGALTWSDTIQVVSPITGFLLNIAAGSVTLGDGQVLYVPLVRAPTRTQTVSVAVSNQVPPTDTDMLLAVRVGTQVYWRNGLLMNDGDSYTDVGAGQPGAGAGSYLDLAGPYSYTEAGIPVEEVMGQTPFDGSRGSGATLNLTVVITPTLTSGSCSVKLYDLGPVGTPTAPRLVSTLTTSTSGGPQVLQQTLTVVAAAPSTNQVLDVDHVYEVAVTSAAATGDTVYVGGARIEVV